MTKKILVLFVFVFLIMLVFTQSVLAVDPPGSAIGQIDSNNPSTAGINSKGEGPVSVGNLRDMVIDFVNWFSWFVAVAAVVMGLYSGFLFITARDNANQLTTARQIMMYAIIGIGVAIIAFSLITISRTFLFN